MPKPPTIPASLAAIVTMIGLGIMYYALTGLGLLTPSGAQANAGSATGIAPVGGGSSTAGSTPVVSGGGLAPPSGITPRKPGSGGIGGGK